MKVFSEVYLKWTFLICLALSCFFQAFVLKFGWDLPVLGFRESHTAMAAYYLEKGGPWFAYEVPIIGPPWAWPIEFPLYQWFVALISRFFLDSTDYSVRVVSLAFFYFTLVPAYFLCRQITKDSRFFLCFSVLFLVSPLYNEVSRSALIESLTIFLGVSYSAFFGEYLLQKKKRYLCFSILFASLLALVKITTLAGFCVITLAQCFILKQKYKEDVLFIFLVKNKPKVLFFTGLLFVFFIGVYFSLSGKLGSGSSLGVATKVLMFLSLVPVILYIFCYKKSPLKSNLNIFLFVNSISFLVFLPWLKYSAEVRALSPTLSFFSDFYANFRWYIGFVGQRFDLEIIKNLYYFRVELLQGSALLVWSVFIVSLMMNKKSSVKNHTAWILVFLFAFVFTILMFTNTHHIHIYYTATNGIFLILGLALSIYSFIQSEQVYKRVIGMLVFFLLFGVSAFKSDWYLDLVRSTRDKSIIAQGKIIQDTLLENEVLIVVGDHLDPSLAYLSKRRALMLGIDRSLSDKNFLQALDLLKKDAYYKVGGVLLCRLYGEPSTEAVQELRKLIHFAEKPFSSSNRCDFFKLVP